jgi:hypothetical protein
VRPWCCRLRAIVVLQAACDRGAAGCVGAFERTKCGRTHYDRIFTLSPLSCPLLAMFVAMTCTTHNTKNYTKILVINVAKSLTNISKGGSNNQYLTPITNGSKAPYNTHLTIICSLYSKPITVHTARTIVPCLMMHLDSLFSITVIE